MKPSQLTIIIGCLLLAGCQSATSLPSRLSSSLFGPSKSKHTLSSNTPEASSPSAMQLSSDDFRQGEEALKKGNLKQAKQSFLAVVKQQPENGAAHHRLGYIADKSGNFTMSRIHYLTAIKLEPNNADIVCDLGYSYLLQNKLEDSQRYLEKALTINPAHKSSLLNMASLLGKQGNYDGALAIFRQAGNEQQAQENIAHLFPNGRPAGSMVASKSEQPNQVTQDLQKRIAESVANNSNNSRKKRRLEQLDPREIPTEQINDIFAQIDHDFDRKQKTSPPAAPGNRATIPPSSLPESRPFGDDLIAQTPQQPYPPQNGLPVTPASNSYSSVPGNIPTENIPGNLEDYAILRPQAETPPAGINPAGFNPKAAPNTQHYPVPTSPQTGSEPPRPVINSPSPNLQQQNTNPQFGLNTQPVSAPAIQQPVTAPQTDAASYQQAVALAMQMGMNAGPGQMFPLKSGRSAPASQSYPSGLKYPAGQPSTQPVLSNQQLPPLTPSMQQGAIPNNMGIQQRGLNAPPKHQHPFQHLPVQPPTTNLTIQNQVPSSPPVARNGNNLFSPEAPSTGIVVTTPSLNRPTQRGGEIRNWPHAPNSQLQQTSHEQKQPGQVQQVKSETPWLNQHQSKRPFSTQQPTNNQRPQMNGQSQKSSQLPVMQPISRGRNSPTQWPYSPQTEIQSPSAQNGPVIHRRSQIPAQRSNPLGTPNPSMPQVVPGVR